MGSICLVLGLILERAQGLLGDCPHSAGLSVVSGSDGKCGPPVLAALWHEGPQLGSDSLGPSPAAPIPALGPKQVCLGLHL